MGFSAGHSQIIVTTVPNTSCKNTKYVQKNISMTEHEPKFVYFERRIFFRLNFLLTPKTNFDNTSRTLSPECCNIFDHSLETFINS